jgi:hypothetical protein
MKKDGQSAFPIPNAFQVPLAQAKHYVKVEYFRMAFLELF